MKFHLLFIYFLVAFPLNAHGQDNLLDQLLEEEIVMTEKVTGTFKGTRLINGHSIETRNRGVLDVLISHRFGRIDGGAYQFFGLDQANMRLGLEYGITDRLNIGMGRNSFHKVFDGFIKYRILEQQAGSRVIPVSLVWFSNMSISSLRLPGFEQDFNRRLGFTNQALIARKMSDKISLQLAPTYVRKNGVIPGMEQLDLLVLGMGGSYRLTKMTSLKLEYFPQMNKSADSDFYNAIAVGVDIETGGHVFQLHLTNAQAMTETSFIPETAGNFFDGAIHFGFNISRIFQLKR